MYYLLHYRVTLPLLKAWLSAEGPWFQEHPSHSHLGRQSCPSAQIHSPERLFLGSVNKKIFILKFTSTDPFLTVLYITIKIEFFCGAFYENFEVLSMYSKIKNMLFLKLSIQK